jgi:hypothetical protein
MMKLDPRRTALLFSIVAAMLITSPASAAFLVVDVPTNNLIGCSLDEALSAIAGGNDYEGCVNMPGIEAYGVNDTIVLADDGFPGLLDVFLVSEHQVNVPHGLTIIGKGPTQSFVVPEQDNTGAFARIIGGSVKVLGIRFSGFSGMGDPGGGVFQLDPWGVGGLAPCRQLRVCR